MDQNEYSDHCEEYASEYSNVHPILDQKIKELEEKIKEILNADIKNQLNE